MVTIPLELKIGPAKEAVIRAMNRIQDLTVKTGATFKKFGSSVNSVFKDFKLLSAGIVATLTAILVKSPSLAGIWEKMKFQFFKISEALGRALKPAFEWILDRLTKLGTWISNNESSIRSFAKAFTDLGDMILGAGRALSNLYKSAEKTIKLKFDIDLGDKLGKLWEVLGPEFIGALIGASIGFKYGGGLPGAAFGAAVGFGGVGIMESLLKAKELPGREPEPAGGFWSAFLGGGGRDLEAGVKSIIVKVQNQNGENTSIWQQIMG